MKTALTIKGIRAVERNGLVRVTLRYSFSLDQSAELSTEVALSGSRPSPELQIRPQGIAEGLEFTDFLLRFSEGGLGNVNYTPAGLLALPTQIENPLDLIQRKSERLRLPDKAETPQGALIVDAVTSGGAGWFGKQAFPLVIAYGIGLYPSPLRQLPD